MIHHHTQVYTQQVRGSILCLNYPATRCDNWNKLKANVQLKFQRLLPVQPVVVVLYGGFPRLIGTLAVGHKFKERPPCGVAVTGKTGDPMGTAIVRSLAVPFFVFG